eukprot:scaffold5013_cov273-Pinguiococcus_pyrenoidosus.AAC.7
MIVCITSIFTIGLRHLDYQATAKAEEARQCSQLDFVISTPKLRQKLKKLDNVGYRHFASALPRGAPLLPHSVSSMVASRKARSISAQP